MSNKINNIYQFKITMQDVTPLIWRRIQVPEDYSFWDLHVAIQDAMGWQNCHLHAFTPIKKNSFGRREYIGIPGDDFDDKCKAGWEIPISMYFIEKNDTMRYEYDFGDDWEHIIELEKILPAEEGIEYPVCIGGERACPPEDCGGFPGYEEILKILKNPKSNRYKEIRSWIGKGFNPEYFDHTKIRFYDPKKRWEQAFTED